MAEKKKETLQPIDFIGIDKLLSHLVAKDIITCEEQDRIIKRIALNNDMVSSGLSITDVCGQAKTTISEKATCGKIAKAFPPNAGEKYISLTELIRAHSEDPPGYVIQSWLRSGTTLAFLNLWEVTNNPDYRKNAYLELLEKKKMASFTLTPKVWISQTKAIGLVSKQGKSGGTFAHPMIACEFASWLTPDFKMLLLELSLDRRNI